MKKLIFLTLLFGVAYGQTKPCPLFGDKNNAKIKALDLLKNRSTPGALVDNTVTLEKILSPGDDRTRFTPNQYVTITGYVVLVKPGGPETCECHSKNPADLDIHIELALKPTDKGAQAMVVEINRFVKAKNPDFTVAKLKQYIGKKMTVSGWMFFDEEHWQNAVTTNPTGHNNWRYTCWELHPVLTIVPAI